MKELIVDFSAYDSIIKDLEALEQAIVDMCDIKTVHAIHERKRMIRKR